MTSDAIRLGALYVPIAVAAVEYRLRERQTRLFAAFLLSILWTLPALIVLQRLNLVAVWWSYAPADLELRGMPLELLIGWAIFWGVVPQIALTRWPIWRTTLFMATIDLLVMPRFAPVVLLRQNWLEGELVAVLVVLLPALCIAQSTLHNSHLRFRACFQAVTAAMIFLFLLPELTFALQPGPGWSPLLKLSHANLSLGLQLVFLAAVPGLSAVLEFAERGGGTPIPYDPPRALVVSGVYRYLANPMQFSCALTMLCWAAILRNGWYALAAAVSVVYSAGLAAWDEGADLSQRFGEPWSAYRLEVRDWLPRWRPYSADVSATIYLSKACGPCSEVRRWLEAQHPLGLTLADAETLPQGTTRRMLYQPGDGSEAVAGVRAVGRALEHIHLGYAFAGMLLRLPGIWQVVQGLMDVSGMGPRDITSVCTTPPATS